ncbi:hypothetical protein [Xanthobacter sp. ZOL 2024]
MEDIRKIITPEGGRVGAKQAFYYGIAEEAFVECVVLAAERRVIPTATERWSNEEAALRRLEDRQLAASVRCIVFAGMCLEAAIYDYAAWHLPELVVEGLDKVDFLSKWRMVPLLVAKHEIPAGRLTHNALRSLQGLRNRLVHAKSETMANGDALNSQIAKLARENQAIAEGYGVAMEAIVAASIEMDLHASMTINPLPQFIPARDGRPRFLEPERPTELATVIAKCCRSLGA